MVLTSSRYLNRFQSYYFLNIDMSNFFTDINHDDVRRHDSTVHYINHDDVRRHDSTVHYINHDDVRRHDSSKLVNMTSF